MWWVVVKFINEFYLYYIIINNINVGLYQFILLCLKRGDLVKTKLL